MKKFLPLIFTSIFFLNACGDESESSKVELPTEEITAQKQTNTNVEVEVVEEDYDFSEEAFIADFVERYIVAFAQKNLSSVEYYFSEESLLLEEQKAIIQSLDEQNISLQLLNYDIQSVTFIDNYTNEVVAKEKYIIHDENNNTQETVEQTKLYTVSYGYADELIMSSIKVQ